MARKTAKERSRRNRARIIARVREILMSEWDPIGVASIPGADDEYDSYVSKVYTMLMDEQADAYRIAAYLDGVTTYSIGLSPSEAGLAACKKTAAHLIAARQDFERS